jgi:hypothetical protein
MKHKILANNIHIGSGKHGIKKEILEKIFEGHEKYLDEFCYTLQKLIEFKNIDHINTQEINVSKPDYSKFTIWHHIDETYNESWGFDKKSSGCYIYGLYENDPPKGNANFLDSNVFYVGESRAVTRNCMLGRRKDFSCGVKNSWVSPMGNSQAFVRIFGKEKIKYVYQAFLPMHHSLVKETELDLLLKYYLHHGKVPICNPINDQRKVEKLPTRSLLDCIETIS